MTDQDPTPTILTLAVDIVTAHVANNSVSAGEIGLLIGTVHQALANLGAAPVEAEPEKPRGAVTARKSLGNTSHIVSMIDGKPYKMLKRHVGQNGYTPASYREAFGLPHDYPMVAPDYGEQRRQIAVKIGLGRKPKAIESAKALPSAKTSARAKAAVPAKPALPAEAVVSAKPAGLAETPAAERATASATASPKPRRQLKASFGGAAATAKQHPSGE